MIRVVDIALTEAKLYRAKPIPLGSHALSCGKRLPNHRDLNLELLSNGVWVAEDKGHLGHFDDLLRPSFYLTSPFLPKSLAIGYIDLEVNFPARPFQ